MAVSAGVAALFALLVGAQQHPPGIVREDDRFFALGSDSCRPCHRQLHQQWSVSPHARAAEELSFEQTFDPTCVPCHVPDAPALEEGVGCEACHGPGSAYAELDVMVDPFKRRAAGLLDPVETCAACHNPGHDDHVERDLERAARGIHLPVGGRR